MGQLREKFRLGSDFLLVQEEPAKAATSFLDFATSLERKYPDRSWLPERAKAWLANPYDPHRPFTAILAQSPSQVFGVLIGEEIVDQGARDFRGHFMIVDPEFQNKGIGSTVIEDLQSHYDSIELDVHAIGTRPGDPDLNDFYLKRGFRRTMDDPHKMMWRRI